ncbi:MAG TPA: DNA helicase, partial [Acidiphilium sp.]
LRPKLRRIGVRAGAFALCLPSLLKPRSASLRATLWATWHRTGLPALPAPGSISTTVADWPDGLAEFLGWYEAGPRAIRLDIAERIAGELRHVARRHPVPVSSSLVSRLGIAQGELAGVLRGLGLWLIAGEILPKGAFGPPAPARVAIASARRTRPKPVEARPAPVNPDHPFAALAEFRRAAS